MSSLIGFVWDEIWPSLTLTGGGTRAFLQGQTTADVLSVEDNRIFQSCWLTNKGQFRALLEIKITNDVADVIALAGKLEDVFNGFEKAIFPADNLKVECIKNIKRVHYFPSQKFNIDPETYWLPIDKPLPGNLKDVDRANPEDVERWRLQNGFILGQGEINLDTNPFELGLSDLVSLNKGCYLGQEIVARIIRGGIIKKHLRFWESKYRIGLGQKLLTSGLNNSNAGTVTTISKYLIDGRSMGLAMITRKALLEEELFVAEDKNKSLRIFKPQSFKDLSDCFS